MKKIAVVACGWHYPSQFYENMVKQNVPEGYEIEYYVVMHRDPKHAFTEHNTKQPNSKLGKLNLQLYAKDISKTDIESLGWKCIPGINGCEWQAANTWLSSYNYNDYEYILFCGDDTLIINNDIFTDILNKDLQVYDNPRNNSGNHYTRETKLGDAWLMISNSMQKGRGIAFRGSFEIFKPEFLDKIGGLFDLSTVTLNRDGETTTPKGHNALKDWNNHIRPLWTKLNELKIEQHVYYFSRHYRTSKYAIEAERGSLEHTSALGESYIQGVNKYVNNL